MGTISHIWASACWRASHIGSTSARGGRARHRPSLSKTKKKPHQSPFPNPPPVPTLSSPAPPPAPAHCQAKPSASKCACVGMLKQFASCSCARYGQVGISGEGASGCRGGCEDWGVEGVGGEDLILFSMQIFHKSTKMLTAKPGQY